VTVVQNYTSIVSISCPSGYQVLAASCNEGAALVLHDKSVPPPPAGSFWDFYLTPNASAATGVYCNLNNPYAQSQAQLRCIK
jgi:hypothetical protein